MLLLILARRSLIYIPEITRGLYNECKVCISIWMYRAVFSWSFRFMQMKAIQFQVIMQTFIRETGYMVNFHNQIISWPHQKAPYNVNILIPIEKNCELPSIALKRPLMEMYGSYRNAPSLWGKQTDGVSRIAKSWMRLDWAKEARN